MSANEPPQQGPKVCSNSSASAAQHALTLIDAWWQHVANGVVQHTAAWRVHNWLAALSMLAALLLLPFCSRPLGAKAAAGAASASHPFQRAFGRQRRSPVRPVSTRCWLPHALPHSLAGEKEALEAASSFAAASTRAPRGAAQAARRLAHLYDFLCVRLAFKLQEVMLANMMVKVVAVCVAATPVVFLGGWLYSRASGEKLGWSLFKIYAVLYKAPGVNVMIERNFWAGLILNFCFVASIFTFAVVLGVVGEEVKKQLTAVRDGNYPVLAADHTVVLNWNRQTVPLLRQLAVARLDEQPVVVLANRPKAEMDAEVAAQLRGYPRLRVATRTGRADFVKDLAGVSVGQAARVILLHPESASDAITARTASLVGLQHSRAAALAARGEQHVIIQTFKEHSRCSPETCRHKAHADAVGRALGSSGARLVEVHGTRDIARIMAQTAVQRGVATVYCTLAERLPGAPIFTVQDVPGLEGRTYKQVRRSFPEAVVCGVVTVAERQLMLNPLDSLHLHAGDRIVMLAPPGARQEMVPDPGRWVALCGGEGQYQALLERTFLSPPPSTARPQHILVAGWAADISDLAEGLLECAAPASTCTVVAPVRPVGLPPAGQEGAAVQFSWIKGVPSSLELLRRAGLEHCDAVIIGDMYHLTGAEADAQMLSTLLLLQDALRQARRPRSAHIVSTVHHHTTVTVANQLLRDCAGAAATAELLHPDELIGGLVTQVAGEPDLAPLLKELLTDSRGQEIYLRKPGQYRLDLTRPTSFAEVAELARLKRETAIGYFTAGGRLMLAPPASHQHVFDKHDRVVAIAEDWQMQPTTLEPADEL